MMSWNTQKNFTSAGEVWFFVSFCVGLYSCFQNLGDYTTAHSLALGLLLSWLPVLVLMSIADRNPNGSDRCKKLIERWLFNVNKVLIAYESQIKELKAAEETKRKQSTEKNLGEKNPDEKNMVVCKAIPKTPSMEQPARKGEHPASIEASEEKFLNGPTEQDKNPYPVDWWTPDPSVKQSNHCNLVIGDYVGQGRYLRYCGLANVFLSRLEEPCFQNTSLAPKDMDEAADLDIHEIITVRPGSWWFTWLEGQLIVSLAISMAFTISFNTPTIGLGCRSFFYLIFWMLSTVSWVILSVRQEPPAILRTLSITANALSASLLTLLMIFHTAGSLNTCFCQSSLFGSRQWGFSGNWGGYVQFGDRHFYESAYHVQNYWYPAAAIGIASCIFFVVRIMWAWQKGRALWDQPNTEPEFDPAVSTVWLT